MYKIKQQPPELLIKQIKAKLATYLDKGGSPKEIYKLSEKLDKLIVEHCNLLNIDEK